MKIVNLAGNAHDLEEAYDGLKRAVGFLRQNYIGKTRIEINKAIKKLERARPHLKYKGRPVRRKW